MRKFQCSLSVPKHDCMIVPLNSSLDVILLLKPLFILTRFN